mmetsp:Transcript_24625/g.62140  ORF Transcript_24625/g.62140 Transcript_24625/m.62140 type:complete len:220 (-) Transcript_24625:1082-1741(-)
MVSVSSPSNTLRSTPIILAWLSCQSASPNWAVPRRSTLLRTLMISSIMASCRLLWSSSSSSRTSCVLSDRLSIMLSPYLFIMSHTSRQFCIRRSVSFLTLSSPSQPSFGEVGVAGPALANLAWGIIASIGSFPLRISILASPMLPRLSPPGTMILLVLSFWLVAKSDLGIFLPFLPSETPVMLSSMSFASASRTSRARWSDMKRCLGRKCRPTPCLTTL